MYVLFKVFRRCLYKTQEWVCVFPKVTEVGLALSGTNLIKLGAAVAN